MTTVYRLYTSAGPHSTVFTSLTDAEDAAADLNATEDIEEVEAEIISKQRAIIGRTVYDVDRIPDLDGLGAKLLSELSPREIRALRGVINE